jgi:single-strand DNA-binding protein
MLVAEVVQMTEKATEKATGQTTRQATGKAGDRAAAQVGNAADNTVELRGRVTSAPIERELPSGAVIVTFRMSVPRARTPMTAGSSQGSDWVDCVAWSARSRRSVAAWEVGDQVALSGALRRRFYRAGDGAGTRLEVEVLGARRARSRDRPGA